MSNFHIPIDNWVGGVDLATERHGAQRGYSKWQPGAAVRQIGWHLGDGIPTHQSDLHRGQRPVIFQQRWSLIGRIPEQVEGRNERLNSQYRIVSILPYRKVTSVYIYIYILYIYIYMCVCVCVTCKLIYKNLEKREICNMQIILNG